MASRPEDFSAKVREAVAKRAAYICSRPGCGAGTIQAHSSDPMGYVATGIAATFALPSLRGLATMKTKRTRSGRALEMLSGSVLLARCLSIRT